MGQVPGTSAADVYAELKQWYAEQPVDNAWARNNPLWQLMRKDANVGGSFYPQPLNLGGSQDYVDFGTAQTLQAPVNPVTFQVPYLNHYVLATVQNSVILASRTKQGAFKEVLKQSCDAAMENSVLADAAYLYRSGTGAIGTIKNTAISNGVVYLNVPTDGIFFQKNQVLIATSTDGGGTQRSGVGYVLAVDPTNGVIQVSATGMGGAPGTPSGWSVNSNSTFGDYLYPQSNLNAQMNGLAGWMPSATSSRRPVIGTTNVFLGVDRSQDPTRSAGTAIDASPEDIEGALIDLISAVKSVGKGTPEYTFINPVSMRALTKALQARRSYVNAETTSEAGITFRGVMVEDSMVLQDPSCPQKQAFALDMETWKIVSFGQNPGFLPYPDGLEGFRVSTADALEARMGGYRNAVCTNPSRNGTAILPI